MLDAHNNVFLTEEQDEIGGRLVYNSQLSVTVIGKRVAKLIQINSSPEFEANFTL